ncbi:multicopper oxidase family protein [Paenibacillus urinalis]|uniref:Copper-containing nitrite reductase n=1 Tax=Paenibacillus urinalis TaxID=521520 RepID=A0AAX3MSA2_9BACL|nr:multicopper oxidase family protein [Paenibacillus urinalis]WDH80390.1 multicopper oxidase family protein [Paenibacillus urinalis]
MKKAFNMVWILAVVLLIILFVMSIHKFQSGKYPEEINMGEMHLHSHDIQDAHDALIHTDSDLPEQSCPELTAQPGEEPVRTYQLQAEQTELTMDNGKRAKAWTFNGSTPGPELRVKEGERVVVQLSNKNVEKGVTIHWHGVVLPCSQDGVAGVTQNAVMPGETFTYEFIAKHPGTYWYHSHQQSSEQSSKGLIGRLIVEPEADTYHYDHDYAVTLSILDDRYVLTNGHENGIQLPAEPGDTVRLRLINASNLVQWMSIAGTDYQVISMDGQDLNKPGMLVNTKIPIGGGQRYDLLFTVPEQGAVRVYSNDEEKWSIRIGSGEVFDIEGTESAFDFTRYGEPVSTDPIQSNTVYDKEFNLDLGAVNINGEQFHHIPPMIVKEGDKVKIRLQHQFGAEHPMHLHGHLFRVISKNGQTLTRSPVYLDSLLLFRGDVYEIAFEADNPGLWMMHCHNLGHAANGMSMMLNYDGVTTPYTVGTIPGNLPD